MFEMATRNPASVQLERDGCTGFVLHKSQQSIFNGVQEKIIDYTEHRLLRYASTVRDAQQRLVLMALIVDYREGNVAVGWHRGRPTYIKVTRDA